MSVDLANRTMLEAFKQKKAPTMFLSGFFKTPPRNIVRSREVVIDVKRNKESIAVDVIRGTGGRFNLNKRFTTKKYEPPVYDEYSSIYEEEGNDRLPGQTEYDTMDYVAKFIAKATDDQVEHQEKILRAIEKQAADVLFTGTVPLINNDTIDYQQKATHNFQVGTSWSDEGAPALGDLSDATELNREDGKLDSDIAIFGKTALKNFLNNTEVLEKGDLRRINRMDIIPPVMNTSGATFHGQVTAGSYNLQIWSYPQVYEVPIGFSLPNEGELVPYVPENLVCVIGSNIRMDLVFAGIPNIVRRVDPRLEAFGIPGVPINIPIDFNPYMLLDERAISLEAGVRSAPLCIPTQIDGYCVIDTVAAT